MINVPDKKYVELYNLFKEVNSGLHSASVDVGEYILYIAANVRVTYKEDFGGRDDYGNCEVYTTLNYQVKVLEFSLMDEDGKKIICDFDPEVFEMMFDCGNVR